MTEFSPQPLFPVLAFIGLLFAGFPLPWHIQHSWNTGICMLMLWTSIGCLIWFINAVVWRDNVVNWAPVWCDICVRFVIGGSTGIPASALCMMRRVYQAIKLPRMPVGKKERRYEVAVDISIGFGFPCVIMILEYVVQRHRFIILEQIGCHPASANTLAEYFLLAMWPLVFSTISIVYAVLIFRRTLLLRIEVNGVLRTGSAISTGRYWLLMIGCIAEVLFTFPLSVFNVVSNVGAGRAVPYGSWTTMHAEFSEIGQYPTAAWQSIRSLAIEAEITRWIYILSAFAIFAFFGWGQQAREYYRQVFRSAYQFIRWGKAFGPLLPAFAVSR